MGQGASLGGETVLANSGRAGEVAAGVGRVRCLAFLDSLRLLLNESVNIRALLFCHAQVVCQHPSRSLSDIDLSTAANDLRPSASCSTPVKCES